METKLTRRIVAVAILALWVSGCSEYDTVEVRKLSNDGQFWAALGIQHTGSLDFDRKVITIGKTYTRWVDLILGKKSKEICALQGNGQLTMTWTDAKHLEVDCVKCDVGVFSPSLDDWQGISIRYVYNGRPVP